ncbi:Prolyl 4-hydroxylase subunit alpha-1 [Orchesella cincta]|uniref:Prolyl 4-hydroxylase subunit alpha-1 n=1 Tax=Orchesella cincta TaxID=48709 RepID=A0A1D2N7N7_ORCCI|nr:Prolyl 4-hydroxylase subunit alpha-1 [Orchesella cincta]
MVYYLHFLSDLAGEIIKKGEKLPSFEDFIGGSMALVGLQDTYALNLSEIIHGDLSTENAVQKSPYELSARDCLFLGKAAFNKGLYDRAVGWLEMALSRAKEEYEDETLLIPTATKEEILPFLETTRRVHDEVLEKRGPYGETWQTFEKPINGKLAKMRKYQKIKRYQPKIMVPLTPVEENENFKALCRGENLRSPKLDAPLRCRYLRRPNSVSILKAYKVEEMSLDPYIAIYHDFMSEYEMGYFKEHSTSRLKRSLHQGRDGRYIATDIRTSKQAWLNKDDGPLIDKISARIGDATGLEVFPENEASEIYQVANYGMAGRYSPHTDYITGDDHLHNPLELVRGNRIATFMVYLEDVPAGGSTVFPLIGVQVKPRKGAAVFWWNLRTDGRGDPWTRHAGCSVLYGNKWITNKWIRYHHQFRRIPCVKEPDNERTASFQTLAY